MFISDFIVDRERGRRHCSGEAIVLQSHRMRMQGEVQIRHDKREICRPESVSALLVAPTKHEETAIEKTVSSLKYIFLTVRDAVKLSEN